MAVQSINTNQVTGKLLRSGYEAEIKRLRIQLQNPAITSGDRDTINAKIEDLKAKIRTAS